MKHHDVRDEESGRYAPARAKREAALREKAAEGARKETKRAEAVGSEGRKAGRGRSEGREPEKRESESRSNLGGVGRNRNTHASEKMPTTPALRKIAAQNRGEVMGDGADELQTSRPVTAITEYAGMSRDRKDEVKSKTFASHAHIPLAKGCEEAC